MHREPAFVRFDHAFDRFGVMWGQSIPDEDESSVVLISLFHIIQYAKDCFGIDAATLHPGQVSRPSKMLVPGNHAEKCETLPSSGRYGNRCNSLPAPSRAHRWFVGHAGFIEKAKCRLVFQAPFLTAGHVVLIQVVIAFSSRSRALRSGFWQENPNRSMVCQTERSSYEMPVSFLM